MSITGVTPLTDNEYIKYYESGAPSLSESEHEALAGFLHQGREYVSHKHLKLAAGKFLLPRDSIVYRGFDGNHLPYEGQNLVGKKLGDDRWLSATTHKDVARRFADNTSFWMKSQQDQPPAKPLPGATTPFMLRIKLKKGSNIIPLNQPVYNEDSADPDRNEWEMLLPSKSELSITKYHGLQTDKHGSYHLYTAEHSGKFIPNILKPGDFTHVYPQPPYPYHDSFKRNPKRDKNEPFDAEYLEWLKKEQANQALYWKHIENDED